MNLANVAYTRLCSTNNLHLLFKSSGPWAKYFSLSSSAMSEVTEQYDYLVLGGGSGGIASANEAKALGAKVALLDYVTPSPQGTSWGLGGTCVNVGCIPKKLMHQAALLGEAIKDSESFGWTFNEGASPKNNWESLVTAVTNHVKSVNWLTRVGVRNSQIDYINALGSFKDANTIAAKKKDGSIVNLSAKNILIAVGGRPRYLDIPGAELAITSDDIFHMRKPPGKTLVVGAGYVALECAGFLHGLGFPVTVMVRGLVLRSFDQQMAGLIVENMKDKGIDFAMNAQPISLVKDGANQIRVNYDQNNSQHSQVFDTVLLAVGRTPLTANLNLDLAGVKVDPATGKIPAINEQTNVPHIYAVGDVVLGKPELTPVAIQAGKLLARRIFGKSTAQMDYQNVATTVFTPLEYGCVGLSEEEAVKKHGDANIEVYHGFYKPTEFMIPQKSFAQCYMKVICLLKEGTILGIHFLGPHAGEVLQGYAVAMKCGVKIDQLVDTVGIHPTVSEELTRLFITKRSGLDPSPQICCS